MRRLAPPPAPVMPPRVGWLFAYDWDLLALQRLQREALARFDGAGFDLFSFPSQLRLAGFDLERFAQRQAARGRRRGWQGVLSHHEQFGALAAALVAERLGLPGPRPQAVLAAQHKLHARRVLQQVAPEANLGFVVLDARYGDPVPEGLRYPAYAKPVKAAFSVLARRVDDRATLQAHTRFTAWEQWLVRQLTEPFDRVAGQRLPEAGSAHRLLLEEPVAPTVAQYNLDGWVRGGRVHALGVVDAVMVPGTQAFMRWELPSRLDAATQARVLDVAQRFLGAIGFDDGVFNLEFFHDARTGRISVIECNPRMASQFGDLYRRVLGVDVHAMAVALALGRDPLALPRAAPSAAVAASLVYRSFPGQTVPAPPDAARRRAFGHDWPDGLLFSFPKRGSALERDYRWTGSHRYGVVHLGARDRDELRQRAERASALVGWPAPYVPHASHAVGAAATAPATATPGATGAPDLNPPLAGVSSP